MPIVFKVWMSKIICAEKSELPSTMTYIVEGGTKNIYNEKNKRTKCQHNSHGTDVMRKGFVLFVF